MTNTADAQNGKQVSPPPYTPVDGCRAGLDECRAAFEAWHSNTFDMCSFQTRTNYPDQYKSETIQVRWEMWKVLNIADPRSAITEALLDYRLQSFLVADDDYTHLPLVDLLSAGPAIDSGKQEIELLADFIADRWQARATTKGRDGVVSAEAVVRLLTNLEIAHQACDLAYYRTKNDVLADKYLAGIESLREAKSILATMQEAKGQGGSDV